MVGMRNNTVFVLLATRLLRAPARTPCPGEIVTLGKLPGEGEPSLGWADRPHHEA